jgi:hypothetical protein
MNRGEGEAAAVKCTLDRGEKEKKITLPIPPDSHRREYPALLWCRSAHSQDHLAVHVHRPLLQISLAPFTGLTEERRYDHTSRSSEPEAVVCPPKTLELLRRCGRCAETGFG